MALYIDLTEGDSVSVGGAIITLHHKSGRKSRISIDADRETPVKFQSKESNQNHSKSSDFSEKKRTSATLKGGTHGSDYNWS